MCNIKFQRTVCDFWGAESALYVIFGFVFWLAQYVPWYVSMGRWVDLGWWSGPTQTYPKPRPPIETNTPAHAPIRWSFFSLDVCLHQNTHWYRLALGACLSLVHPHTRGTTPTQPRSRPDRRPTSTPPPIHVPRMVKIFIGRLPDYMYVHIRARNRPDAKPIQTQPSTDPDPTRRPSHLLASKRWYIFSLDACLQI